MPFRPLVPQLFCVAALLVGCDEPGVRPADRDAGSDRICPYNCEDTGMVCDTERHECVGCRDSADCDDPNRPACVAGTCGGCSDDAHCTEFAGRTVCDPPSGACVECTPDSALACSGNLCDPANLECTERTPHSRDLCDECVSDIDCMEGQLCISTELEGNRCFWREGEVECDPGRRPFLLSALRTSVDLVTERVCLPRRSSCRALTVHGIACSGPEDSATLCSLGAGDGYCAMADDGMLHCLASCEEFEDCPEGFDCIWSETEPLVCGDGMF